MGRTYDEWIKTIDPGLVASTRKDDEANKPILNQLNWICCKHMLVKKSQPNPSSAELLDWVTSGQIDAMRK